MQFLGIKFNELFTFQTNQSCVLELPAWLNTSKTSSVVYLLLVSSWSKTRETSQALFTRHRSKSDRKLIKETGTLNKISEFSTFHFHKFSLSSLCSSTNTKTGTKERETFCNCIKRDTQLCRYNNTSDRLLPLATLEVCSKLTTCALGGKCRWTAGQGISHSLEATPKGASFAVFTHHRA